MKLATLALLLVLAAPAGAAVIHDESVDGDLSTDPNAPTALVFAVGGNTIIGTVANSNQLPPAGDRDFITFTIPAGQALTGLNLLAYSPDNLGFAAFNAGATGFIPSAATNGNFLAGIHPGGAHVGTDLMPLFVDESVTLNALPAPRLEPGTYTFIFQQTTNIVQSYSLEFVVDAETGAEAPTWGAIKSLYR
jgi:hypothetical protein